MDRDRNKPDSSKHDLDAMIEKEKPELLADLFLKLRAGVLLFGRNRGYTPLFDPYFFDHDEVA